MNFYRIHDDTDRTPIYRCTFAEAKTSAQNHPNGDDVRVELIDIETDKASLCDILNDTVRVRWPVQRTWRLTSRGGLTECPNGE